MPLTNYALDNFISQHLSQLTQCNAQEVSSRFPQNKFWVSNFSLNSMLGSEYTKEGKTFSFFFLRRAEAAFTEYEYACEALSAFITTKPKSPSLYFKTLYHFEMAVSMMWQAFDQYKKYTNKKIFRTNDGSKYERLNLIYNTSRHFKPSELSVKNIQVIWLTNNGIRIDPLKSKYPEIEVTYPEIESLLIEIGNMANEYSVHELISSKK